MTRFKDIPSRQVQGEKGIEINRCGNENHESIPNTDKSATLYFPMQTECSSFHTEGNMPFALDIEELIHKHSDTSIKLVHSMLTRITIERADYEPVKILCTCEEIGYLGMKLYLPYKLGITEGSVVYMELFLNPEQEPTTVHGKVKKISRYGKEDAVRYLIDLDFCGVSDSAESEIAAFVNASQAQHHAILEH